MMLGPWNQQYYNASKSHVTQYDSQMLNHQCFRLAIEAGSASAKRRKAAPATKISETTTSDFTPGFDYSVQSVSKNNVPFI